MGHTVLQEGPKGRGLAELILHGNGNRDCWSLEQTARRVEMLGIKISVEADSDF
jgi:hypothetical protein